MNDSNAYRSVAGKTMHGPFGKIGKIVDVYESTDGGGLTFATVHTGVFGTHVSFVPLHEASLTDDDVHVPYTKELIHDAPRVDADQELTAEEEARLFRHYDPARTTDAATVTPPVVASAPPAEPVAPPGPRLRRYVDTEPPHGDPYPAAGTTGQTGRHVPLRRP